MGMKGRMVKVVAGRKAPHGFIGRVFWERDTMTAYGSWVKYTRIGIKNEAGDVVWTYATNVEAYKTPEEIAAEDAALAAEKAAEDAKIAARNALLAKVDWSTVVHGKESGEAYGGSWACSMPIPEGMTDEEIIRAIRIKYPAGSSWGALRWPRGASGITVIRENGMVEWMDGYGMCD